MIFQELSSTPNELIPVFQKEPSSGWPEYNTQSTSKPQSGIKQLDRLVQPTTHVTPSTTFLSAIKISAVQTQATSANSSTTVTSSKKRTKTADTIAKKQPRKQFIREIQPSDTARSKYTQDKQYGTQRLSKHYNYSIVTTKLSKSSSFHNYPPARPPTKTTSS